MSYPLSINLLSKDFNPVVAKKQDSLGEEDKSSGTVSSPVVEES